MGALRKSPGAHAGANRASKENAQRNFTRSQNNKPPPLHIAAYVKNVLVQLGANGILPRRFCTKLINILGLRGK
jgi:hypothetical protein